MRFSNDRLRALFAGVAMWSFLAMGCGSESDSDFEPNPEYEREIQEQALDSVPVLEDGEK